MCDLGEYFFPWKQFAITLESQSAETQKCYSAYVRTHFQDYERKTFDKSYLLP